MGQIGTPRDLFFAKLGDMLDSCLDPATRCWTLHADGSWEPSPRPGENVGRVRDHQAEMMLQHVVTSVAEPK